MAMAAPSARFAIRFGFRRSAWHSARAALRIVGWRNASRSAAMSAMPSWIVMSRFAPPVVSVRSVHGLKEQKTACPVSCETTSDESAMS